MSYRLFCPNCCMEQECRVENRTRTYTVRGDKIELAAPTAVCSVCGQELVDENLETQSLRNAYAEYRMRHSILSGGEIAAIREKYGLSQRSLSRLLGWGLVTVQRYEKGAVPDEAHNRVLKSLRSPDYVAELLHDQASLLTERERRKLGERLETLRRGSELQRLLGVAPPSLENGFRTLDLDKMIHMIVFFAVRCKSLWKTKLMKLLFYADFGYYREFALSISGARYARLPRGPVPDGYDALLGYLEQERVLELQPGICGDCEGEMVKPLIEFDCSLFDPDELSMLDRVATMLGGKTATSLSNASHEEAAWKETVNGRIIPYSWADQLTGV